MKGALRLREVRPFVQGHLSLRLPDPRGVVLNQYWDTSCMPPGWEVGSMEDGSMQERPDRGEGRGSTQCSKARLGGKPKKSHHSNLGSRRSLRPWRAVGEKPAVEREGA